MGGIGIENEGTIGAAVIGVGIGIGKGKGEAATQGVVIGEGECHQSPLNVVQFRRATRVAGWTELVQEKYESPDATIAAHPITLGLER